MIEHLPAEIKEEGTAYNLKIVKSNNGYCISYTAYEQKQYVDNYNHTLCLFYDKDFKKAIQKMEKQLEEWGYL